MTRNLNKKMGEIKESSIKLLKLYGLITSFVFVAIFTFFTIGMDLYTLTSKTVYLPRLDFPLILLFFIFLPPILNIFVVEFLNFFDIKLNKDLKWIKFMMFLNFFSIFMLLLFIILVLLLLRKVYINWLNLEVISLLEGGLI